MFFLKINGNVLPTPSFYSVDSDDVDSTDSSRSDETGLMHRRRIRKGIRTCDVKWVLDGNVAKWLNVNLAEPLLSVVLLDPATAGYAECDMYATNLKSTFYQCMDGNEEKSYWEISCRLIEY